MKSSCVVQEMKKKMQLLIQLMWYQGNKTLGGSP